MTDRTTGTDVVAAFDLDGTLTDRDCVLPFLLRVGGWRGVLVALARRPTATVGAIVRRDRDAFKEVVVGGVLVGRRTAAVGEQGRSFAEHVHRHWLRPDVIQRLRWHQRSGHRTVIVSASLGPYLRPLGELLQVDGVLCADAEVSRGRYLDKLREGNCPGPQKLVRLERWMRTEGAGAATVWAYGDSSGDAEMLARADHPTLVRDVVVAAIPSAEAL